MRVCFSVAVALVLSAANVAFSGAVAEDGMQSVLVAQPAVTETVVVAPAPQPAVACEQECCKTAKLYNVEAVTGESCRNRLFGGKVVRKHSRTVYKPVRR
jgi:hypothetical protein